MQNERVLRHGTFLLHYNPPSIGSCFKSWSFHTICCKILNLESLSLTCHQTQASNNTPFKTSGINVPCLLSAGSSGTISSQVPCHNRPQLFSPHINHTLPQCVGRTDHLPSLECTFGWLLP